jgi:hypothetical protein
MTNKKPKKSKIEKVETVKHKVNILKTLTIEERTELFFRICKTRAELKAWIRLFLGLDMPDTTVSRYADTNPLDIIWLIYEICVLEKNPENIEELLCVAGRGSGKCSSKDTKIITQNGPKNIQDIVVNDIVWTGWSWQPVTHTFDEGVKPGVSIATLKGKKNGAFPLTGSLKHRIQALCPKTKKIDWVLMKDLVPGQIVYKTAERVYDNVVDTSSDDYEKGWIIGNITGDGCVSRHGNSISLCGKDDAQILHYCNLVKKHTNSDPSIRLSSRSALIKKVNISSKTFREWHDFYIEGELCYFKKLKTLNHSPSFLAGFISGLMETDGSKDSITFANKELAAQVAQILTIFGVHSVINNSRRPSAITKFEPGHTVTYHETKFNNLPDYMLPLFSKRKTFIQHRQKQNEQFRYPSILIKSFANFIKDKYEIANGYWRLDKTKVKTHSSIKFSKDLWGNSAKGYESYVYGYKIDDFIKLAEKLNETEWVTYLRFIRNGYYEEVETVKFGNHYFYDLEIEKDHSYASNGFVSHNTLAVAIAEFVLLFHDQRDVAHVGAILSQAKRCYQYQQGFMLSERVKPILSQSIDGFPVMEKTTQEKSSFNVRDRKTGELVKIDLEVLPCTLKSVNGFHGAFVSVDEIDTVQGEGVRAFQDISGMLDSKRGRKSLRVGISTRKTRYGLMNQQIEDADAQGRTVKKWTVLEFSERCPDERSGTTPTVGYYLQDSMEVISEELWLKKDPKKQEEYKRQEFAGEGCLKCPMAALCLSDAKKQTSKSPMLKPISDAIKKTRENGADWAISQLYNLKPSVEGIVYKEFDEKEHVKDWNQMWFALTNQEFPGQCTHDIFVKKCHSMGLSCYAGIDWGWSNPSTVVYFFVDKRENIYVVRCEGRTYTNNPTWAQIIKSKWQHMYRCQLYLPDLANPGDAQTMRTEGLPCPTEQIKDTPGGIQVIKKWLKSLASVNTKMFFAKETCGPIITEFGLYHFKTDAAGKITDDVEKEHDHWLDALRYAMYYLFGKSSAIVGDDDYDIKNSAFDRNGTYSRMPSPEEFALSKNIKINPDITQDKSKLGQIGTKYDLDNDGNDDDGVGGNGSFLWSI